MSDQSNQFSGFTRFIPHTDVRYSTPLNPKRHRPAPAIEKPQPLTVWVADASSVLRPTTIPFLSAGNFQSDRSTRYPTDLFSRLEKWAEDEHGLDWDVGNWDMHVLFLSQDIVGPRAKRDREVQQVHKLRVFKTLFRAVTGTCWGMKRNEWRETVKEMAATKMRRCILYLRWVGGEVGMGPLTARMARAKSVRGLVEWIGKEIGEVEDGRREEMWAEEDYEIEPEDEVEVVGEEEQEEEEDLEMMEVEVVSENGEEGEEMVHSETESVSSDDENLVKTPGPNLKRKLGAGDSDNESLVKKAKGSCLASGDVFVVDDENMEWSEKPNEDFRAGSDDDLNGLLVD